MAGAATAVFVLEEAAEAHEKPEALMASVAATQQRQQRRVRRRCAQSWIRDQLPAGAADVHEQEGDGHASCNQQAVACPMMSNYPSPTDSQVPLLQQEPKLHLQPLFLLLSAQKRFPDVLFRHPASPIQSSNFQLLEVGRCRQVIQLVNIFALAMPCGHPSLE